MERTYRYRNTTSPLLNTRWIARRLQTTTSPSVSIPYYNSPTSTKRMYLDYPGNTNGMNVQYVRNKIGDNYFIVYYKNVAQFKRTPLEVGRVFGVAKFTPSVNALRDWCKEMVEKYESTTDTADSEPIDVAGGFGPECHEEPNDNTRMIT